MVFAGAVKDAVPFGKLLGAVRFVQSDVGCPLESVEHTRSVKSTPPA